MNNNELEVKEVKNNDVKNDEFVEIKFKKPSKKHIKLATTLGIIGLVIVGGVWIAEEVFDIFEHSRMGQEIERKFDELEYRLGIYD